MKFSLLFLGIIFLVYGCGKEPDGSETNCTLLGIYDLDYHSVTAPKVYDIRSDKPQEIINGTIEYDLFWQWQSLTFNGENPWPYNHYFVYSAFFDANATSIVHFTNVDIFNYDFVRDDCHIELNRSGETIFGELVNGGEEIRFDRYAIYDHSIGTSGFDTFSFIEFRNKEFKSYSEIIAAFAHDNKGLYDTVALELVSSRTRE